MTPAVPPTCVPVGDLALVDADDLRRRSARSERSTATLLETAITRVSRANGNDCRPAWVSAVLCAEEERAKSTSALLPAPYSVALPAPEPFGRVIVTAVGSGMVPPPVAAYVAILNAGAGPLAFQASANSFMRVLGGVGADADEVGGDRGERGVVGVDGRRGRGRRHERARSRRGSPRDAREDLAYRHLRFASCDVVLRDSCSWVVRARRPERRAGSDQVGQQPHHHIRGRPGQRESRAGHATTQTSAVDHR